MKPAPPSAFPVSLTIGMVGPWPPPLGGVATACVEISLALARLGHAVHVIDTAAADGAGMVKAATDGLRGFSGCERVDAVDAARALLGLVGGRGRRRGALLVQTLRAALRLSWFRRRPRHVAAALVHVDRMASWLGAARVTAIVGHHAGISSWEGMMVARHYIHCPFLVVIYASEFTMEVNRPLLPVALAVCAAASGLVSISRYTKSCAIAAGVRNPAHHVVALGCDPRHFLPTNEANRHAVCRRLGLIDGRPLILYVGWMLARKGPQVLMEALGSLCDCDWQAVFVGPDHGLGDPLRHAAQAAPLRGRVRILPPVAFNDLLALYDSAAVFVFPTLSRDEGFGLVGLEAMAHGLPVVAARSGAIPEFVRAGETGYLFEPGDAPGLATQLRAVLGDPVERARVGAAGRTWASQFTWDNTAARTAALLQAAVTTNE